MLDRLLAFLLRLVLTTLIGLAGASAVISGYSGFIHLVRIHWLHGVGMIGLALICGAVAYVLAHRRDDLADC